MKKLHVMQNIIESPIVAVVRADSAEQAVRISKACIEGGITNIEVTFTVTRADEAIAQLTRAYPHIIIGAGTVLDKVTARIAILAGAQFIVSPSFDEEIVKLCNLYQVPYIPGCETITEMVMAMTHGADIIKLFPGSIFGPEYVKAIKGPLPHINLMPTGGVSLDNINDWLDNGCIAAGVGGKLIEPAKDENYQEITRLASEYIQKVKFKVTK